MFRSWHLRVFHTPSWGADSSRKHREGSKRWWSPHESFRIVSHFSQFSWQSHENLWKSWNIVLDSWNIVNLNSLWQLCKTCCMFTRCWKNVEFECWIPFTSFTELLHGSSLMVLQQATGASCSVAKVIHDLVRSPPNPSACQQDSGWESEAHEQHCTGANIF